MYDYAVWARSTSSTLVSEDDQRTWRFPLKTWIGFVRRMPICIIRSRMLATLSI
jgi:hypothetical protein